jgi:hypothetical protein
MTAVPRPCGHAELQPGCGHCALYRTRPDIRAIWEARAAAGEPLKAAALDARATPSPARVALPDWHPCVHEGDVLEACQSCGPKGNRHVRECDLFGRCTRDVVRTGVPACRACQSYTPDPALVARR